MLKVVVIGDQATISETIKSISSLGANEVSILYVTGNINEGIFYLHNHQQPDIIFYSPRLGTGLSFEILDHYKEYIPVVFVADDTTFVKNALDYNCIAYLLNPVNPGNIERVLEKYRMLGDYFTSLQSKKAASKNQKHERSRMIVRDGKENIALPINDIVLIHTQHRHVYLADQHGNEYTTDKTLSEIETGLDKESFFRVNRRCIVNINYVHGFKTFERVKLLVELSVPNLKQSVIVSQELARQFREWMYNA